MGNCLTLSSTTGSQRKGAPPIETAFKFPSPLPAWPPGFALGTIDLGGLVVSQVSSLSKVWAAHEGGPDNLGATFFEPSKLQEGFFMLACYGQANNKLLNGWVLAGKDGSCGALQKPIDYTLVWSSESLKIKRDGDGYIWLPVAPEGYKAVGHVVTRSPEKPPLDKVRCVRSDFTDHCETDSWIWGPGESSDASSFNVYGLRPETRGTQALGVSVGTFIAQNGDDDSPLALSCLKNNNPNHTSSMPNISQIQALFQAYSPFVYFHPDETYLPSSVSWFFSNGALLYKKGDESNPVAVEPNGSNLPQGGSNDGAYWLDLPEDQAAKERVKKGDLQSFQAYAHVKPMYGATFTDIALWLFYPFNGPARAKVELITIPLGKIGEHVGDWEHVTLRISNFTGELWEVYFSQHSHGTWVNASELEFQSGNRFVAYASLNGHASYPKPGLVLQGSGGIGIRNDTAKSKMVVDTGVAHSLIAADYPSASISLLPWVNYLREWGPKIAYDTAVELKKVEQLLPGKLKSAFDHLVKSLPSEVLGEEGPTGPKAKSNWGGDEV
ncbi:uncharacterized protein LOC115737067 isoform X2 [Rhodamnia argentea]|uniref:Uncharacterized protein LOC115737067 isoform X2 n=1 Tax=Rhodamnia argentea TaxID=178133 RepID=A0ABM3HW61_9MYRT|nr:uncharacterized protein LOC115737067 isoform X2 [Rhodamnia argentea]